MEFSQDQILQFKAMKVRIKTLAAEQSSLKLQRKTTTFTGTRTLEPYQATRQHTENRYELRHLHLAYGIMRGKKISQIETKSKTPYSESTLKSILAAYGIKDVCIAA